MLDDNQAANRGVFESWLERLLTGAVFLVLVCCLILGWVTRTLVTQQRAARQEVFENRAITCQILVGLGGAIDPSGPCRDPDVLRYYNPRATQPTRAAEVATRSLTVQCAIAGTLKISMPECAKAP